MMLRYLLLAAVADSGLASAGAEADVARSPRLEVSEQSGFHQTPFEVTVTPRTLDASIYFTTDGSAPSTNLGQRYTRPIPVKATTTLRSAEFKNGVLVNDITTRTYLFIAEVLRQNGTGAPSTWGTNDGKPVPADYEMDPEIVSQSAYRDVLPKALKAIPSCSVVMDRDDLFDPVRGIYANPKQSGDDWERAASVELIYPDGRAGFQVNSGIRIQGGWNRRPEESPKHAFRLAFRKKYGAGKLKFRLFQGPGAEEFDGLILRAGCNNSWLHWAGTERNQGDYLRDQWMRDTYAAAGHPSARGLFVHLYLNGLYWGLYNLTERPNEDFAAGHFGGKPKNYDARNGNKVLSGDDTAWNEMVALANSGITDAQSYRRMKELLDVPSFIDYMIVNFYGGNEDWDRASNWYAARRRIPPGPFHFFVWDGERTLERADANTIQFDDDQSPPRLFHKLRENADFRLQFADRVHHLLFNGGALTARSATERFRALAGQIDLAIVAESARWGDYRRDVHPYKVGPYALYTRDQHWRPEIRRLLEEFFPRRTAILLQQFRALKLCPEAFAAPVEVNN
jgi:hypothetical protein